MKITSFAAIIATACAFAACRPEPIKPQPSPITGALTGFYSFTDCSIFICSNHDDPPFPCTGETLEIHADAETSTVIFRSPDWAFYPDKAKLITDHCKAVVYCAKQESPQELTLTLDPAFLHCARSQDGGFWFYLPIL